MQQLLAAPGLACFWPLRVRVGTTPRCTTSRVVRCIRNSRLISTSISRSSREGSEHGVEKFIVKCGSSGSITVDLYNSSALTNPSNTLIIHLPSTGTHLRNTHPPIPSYLISQKTALASINYRWNIPSPSSSLSSPKQLYSSPSYAHHAWPVPLHDTLAGYTFLLSHLTQYNSPPASPSSSFSSTSSHSKPKSKANGIYTSSLPQNFTLPTQRPILLYGSFLGSGLATSLALTENISSRSNPTKIIGLICKDGIYDWTEIVSSLPPALNSSDTTVQDTHPDPSTWTPSTLHALAKTLFPSPSSAFDPFISPTLFLRTSGLSIPRYWPTSEDPDGNGHVDTRSSLSPAETEDIWPSEEDDLHITEEDLHPELGKRSASAVSSPGSETASPSPTTPPSTPTTPTHPFSTPQAQAEISLAQRISQLSISLPSRPAHLKYPPTGSNLKIPFSLFLYTPSPSASTSSLKPQSPPWKPKSKTKTIAKTITKTTTKSKPKPQMPAQEVEQEQNPTSTPAFQADAISFLLRRSVSMHEFGERAQWDSELDAESESQRRVGTRALLPGSGSREMGGRGGAGNEEEGGGEERDIVRRWIEEVAG